MLKKIALLMLFNRIAKRILLIKTFAKYYLKNIILADMTANENLMEYTGRKQVAFCVRRDICFVIREVKYTVFRATLQLLWCTVAAV